MTTTKTETSKRARNFCFTLNNYTDENMRDVSLLVNKVKYICYSQEVGKCGTPHLQGYFELKNDTTISALQKGMLKGLRMSIRVALGTTYQNIIYCSKDNNTTFKEFGEKKQQGKRTDLLEIRDDIMSGKCVDDLAVENPTIFHQYGRTLERLEDIAMRKKYRTEMTLGQWFWGPTGVGKSHKSFEGFTPETHYVLNVNDNGYWEGYKQQPIVIINEFRGQIQFGELLDLVDKYPKTVKRRNRQPLPFTSKLLIITSSMHPHMIYEKVKNNQESLAQLDRRFHIVRLDHVQVNPTEANPTKVVRGGNIDPPSFSLFEKLKSKPVPFPRLAPLEDVACGATCENNDELTDKEIEHINICAKLSKKDDETF
ncbi:MAG: helicase [Cressdnaviricota sp.]|nr:MAG: helicase [Cressdnaviricota sp.]